MNRIKEIQVKVIYDNNLTNDYKMNVMNGLISNTDLLQELKKEIKKDLKKGEFK